MMSEDIHKWSDGKYTLMFDEHTFFVWDNEKEKRMTALQVTKKLNEQQATIEELQQKYDKLCIEMANIYSKYIFMKEFSEDTNPNEAVKYVLRELMQKTKGAR